VDFTLTFTVSTRHMALTGIVHNGCVYALA